MFIPVETTAPIHTFCLPENVLASASRNQLGRNQVSGYRGPDEAERQILNLITRGHPNKNIAADLQISQRTVENHRASIMKKTSTRTLSGLIQVVIAAS